MKKSTLCFSIAYFLSLSTFSQTLKPQKDFSRVDSIAKTVRYKGALITLAKELTDPYPDHLSRARAIFVWLTDNISYDWKKFNKGTKPKTIRCPTGVNCEQLMLEWENKYLHQILKKQKAVCDGYARLFKKMSDVAGIRSEIIEGYTKQYPYQVGLSGELNHAWNAVWFDTAYFFVDPTWAAGFGIEDESTGKLLGFQKRFNEYYWLTLFRDLSRNHYPKEAKWVMEANYTKEKYASHPYYSATILDKIQLLSPASGVLSVKKGDTIRFRFQYQDFFRHLQINSNLFRNPALWRWEEISKKKKIWIKDTLAEKKQRYVDFTRKDYLYEFEYVVTDLSLYYLEILFDHRMVMRFKVKVLD